jgi:hypothetical protein
MSKVKQLFKTNIPTPPPECGDISTTTCQSVDILPTATELSTRKYTTRKNNDYVKSLPATASKYNCDGTCPKADALTTSALYANTYTSSNQNGMPQVSCGTDDAASVGLGILDGTLAMLTGGLVQSFWSPVDDSAYTEMQKKYESLQQEFTNCISRCQNLITAESFNFICCNVSFLRSWVEVELEELRQDFKQSQLLIYLSLGLITLILVYILAQ